MTDKICLVVGGVCEDGFVKEYIKKESFDSIIAVDSGLDFFVGKKMLPDIALGDFDSVSEKGKDLLEMIDEVVFYENKTDFTDTEAAILKAIDMEAKSIHILAGTGGRLDQFLGILQSMALCLEKNVECIMVDSKNRIRLIDSDFEIKKSDQFGKYISFVPFAGDVSGADLKGFKYDVTDYTFHSIGDDGTSNEIEEETAKISFGGGILIVIESKD